MVLEVVDRRATLGTKAECDFLATVRDACVLRRTTLDVDFGSRETRLQPEHAAGPALASNAVAHRNTNRFHTSRDLKLTAAAGCSSYCHRAVPEIRELYIRSSLRSIQARRSRQPIQYDRALFPRAAAHCIHGE